LEGSDGSLERKEKEAKHGAQQSVTIQNSNIANLNLRSQVGEIDIGIRISPKVPGRSATIDW